MRLERLDLIRFGRFAGFRLELPHAGPDLHLLAGRNEAGKTTAMAAIEDLLFGFPARTPYAFRHNYDELRVGAVLQSEGEQLAVRRRKGNRDTLLDDEETPTPAGEAILGRFLGGADREFYRRMFSLSHDRLAEGGREIAAAEGEVGETLFAAGAALRGFRARRKALDGEAAALWTPRRARTRRFYQASDRFAEVDRALRHATKRPEEYKGLRKQQDAAARRQRELEEEYRQATAESRRWSRIRRVLPTVRQLTELKAELAPLAEAVLLPEDAADRVAASKQKAADIVAEVGFRQQELEAKRAARDLVQLDPAIHDRRDSLRELEDMRVSVAKMRLDLPKRQAERDVALRELREAARGLGWEPGPDEALVERVPSKQQLGGLNAILQRRGALVAAVKAAETALGDADRRLDEQRARVSAERHSAAAARLEAVVRANPSAGDIEGRVRDSERERDGILEKVLALRAGLSPALPDDIADEASVRRLPTPNAAEVAHHRDGIRDLDDRIRELQRRLAEAQRQLQADRDRYHALERNASGITRSVLNRARADRDGAWNEVRARLLDDSASGSPEALAQRFEELAQEADAVADRRLAGAETAGRLAETEAAIRDREASVATLSDEANRFKEERERLLGAWQLLWNGCPFDPLSPDRMADWIESQDELATTYRTLSQTERELAALQTEQQEIREQFTDALLPFGISSRQLEEDPLRVVARRADGFVQDERQAERQEKDARSAAETAAQDRNRERDRLETAREEVAAWEFQWSEALTNAGLDPIAPTEGTTGSLTEMRVSVNTVRNVQHRIARMEEDIGRFEERVRRLVAEVADELADLPADQAVLRLGDRLRADLEGRKELEELDRGVTTLEEAIREGRAAAARSEAEIAPLAELAQTTELDALNAAIARSDRRRALENERARLLDRLHREADGLRAAEVLAECDDVDPDEAKVREDEATLRLDEIGQERNTVAQRFGETRKELEAFADDAAAARLAADREEALAALRDSAERYAGIRTAEIMLRYALERFRKEKQGPMLRRAGALFRTLTGGSFASLEVGFDSTLR